MIDTKPDNAYGPFGSTFRTAGPKRFQEDRGMPHRSATQHELARIELLADRFYVLLTGVLAVSQRDLGARSVLRPGDYFGEVAPAMSIPRTATVSAMTPAVVASCDRETFDELLRPLFADDS
jgi:CRP-like cAMP-binding protein